jgi:hypothetical protein
MPLCFFGQPALFYCDIPTRALSVGIQATPSPIAQSLLEHHAAEPAKIASIEFYARLTVS